MDKLFSYKIIEVTYTFLINLRRRQRKGLCKLFGESTVTLWDLAASFSSNEKLIR